MHVDAAAKRLHDGHTEQHTVHLCRPPGDLHLLTGHQTQHAFKNAGTEFMGEA